jgi:hypothetical protein
MLRAFLHDRGWYRLLNLRFDVNLRFNGKKMFHAWGLMNNHTQSSDQLIMQLIDKCTSTMPIYSSFTRLSFVNHKTPSMKNVRFS